LLIALEFLEFVLKEVEAMNILERVQVYERHQQGRTYSAGRATEVQSLREFWYIVEGFNIHESRIAARKWLYSDEASRKLSRYRGQYVAVTRRGVAGHGRTERAAFKMATRKGVSYQETVLTFVHDEEEAASLLC
jgi:hypothetical protein